MVSTFDKGHRNVGKSPEDSHKTDTTVRKAQLRRATTKIGINNTERKETTSDMIEVFKLLAGVENIDCNQFFTPATTCYALRGHDRKLVKTRSRLDTRKFFSQRVVNSWNSLPASVVQATSVNMFKNSYDRYLAGGMDVWATSCLSINLQVQVSKYSCNYPYGNNGRQRVKLIDWTRTLGADIVSIISFSTRCRLHGSRLRSPL